MPIEQFPSERFPAHALVRLEAPDDWQPAMVPAAVLAMAGPLVDGAFRPNVVVTVTRFPADYGLDEAERSLIERTDALPEVQTVGSSRIEQHGTEAFAHEVAFRAEGGGTMVQSHRMVVVDLGPCHDLVHAVASCAAEPGGGDVPVLRTILSSLVAHAPSPSGAADS